MTINECAFRSEHPDVLAVWERIESEEWANQIRDYGIALGVPNGGEFTIWGSQEFAGFTPPERASDVPDGWRVVKVTKRGVTSRHLLPDKRTKIGKAADQWFRDLGRRPYLRDLPGIPAEVIDKHTSRFRTITAFRHNGAVYAHFRVPVEAIEERSTQYTRIGAYDPDMWPSIKVSEYHAALEAEAEDRQQEAAGV